MNQVYNLNLQLCNDNPRMDPASLTLGLRSGKWAMVHVQGDSDAQQS